MVENVVPDPLSGEPPGADHDRDVTVPEIVGWQVICWPTFADPGQPTVLIVGACGACVGGAVGGAVGPADGGAVGPAVGGAVGGSVAPPVGAVVGV